MRERGAASFQPSLRLRVSRSAGRAAELGAQQAADCAGRAHSSRRSCGWPVLARCSWCPGCTGKQRGRSQWRVWAAARPGLRPVEGVRGTRRYQNYNIANVQDCVHQAMHDRKQANTAPKQRSSLGRPKIAEPHRRHHLQHATHTHANKVSSQPWPTPNLPTMTHSHPHPLLPLPVPPSLPASPCVRASSFPWHRLLSFARAP